MFNPNTTEASTAVARSGFVGVVSWIVLM